MADASLPPIQGMRALVVPLRVSGAKMRSEAVEGYLASEEVTNHAFMTYVSRTQLTLYRTADRLRGTLLRPLFDAQLLQWDSRGIFLQGWEIELDADRRPVQFVQIWCINPLHADPAG